jgi:hypothetical protein
MLKWLRKMLKLLRLNMNRNLAQKEIMWHLKIKSKMKKWVEQCLCLSRYKKIKEKEWKNKEI